MTAIVTLLSSVLLTAPAAEHVPDKDLERFEFTQPQMGVPFRIVLYAPDRPTAQRAADAAFARVSTLNAIFSDYEFDSELSMLSRTAGAGEKVPLSPELWNVLERAQALAEKTGGAFDVTVGPAVSLWRRSRRTRTMPDPKRLAQTRAAIGYRHLRLDRETRSAELLIPRMRLDLGGIAKGCAADAALDLLREHGLTRVLVAADGDIVVGDPPPGQKGWRIGIAQLDAPNAPAPPSLILKRRAISTSGDLSQRLEIEGRRYSHIVDPRTGIGLTDHSMVTVLAPDSTTADSLATSISVLGPKTGLALIDQFPGTAVRIVRSPDDQIEVHESPGFSAAYAE